MSSRCSEGRREVGSTARGCSAWFYWSCGGGNIVFNIEEMRDQGVAQGSAAPTRPAHGAVVGIDASRNRSGGAKAHILGILKDSDPREHGIRQVHLWSYRALLDTVPDAPWLVKHNPQELERSLVRQVWWQSRSLPREARRHACDVLLNTDAGSVCRFRPSVVMSRDMLSYEPGEMSRYGLTKARLRLLLLRYVQNRSMRLADGVIFLTRYASEVIQGAAGQLPRVAVVPHGVGSTFKEAVPLRRWPSSSAEPIKCLYVSNAAMYKHQWHVVKAIGELRRRGHNLHLRLVGGGSGRAKRLLDEEIARTDPRAEFVTRIGFVRPDELPRVLANAHLFVFASSCENMPNTLLEAMAVGLPIVCSNRGPMPEVMADGGVFFDPEDSTLRARCASRAKTLADQYSWSRCGRETWEFLLNTIGRCKK